MDRKTFQTYMRALLPLHPYTLEQYDVMADNVNLWIAQGGINDQYANSVRQFIAQAIEMGELKGDEMRAILENAPTVLGAVGAHMVAIGKYDRLPTAREQLDMPVHANDLLDALLGEST